MLKVCAPKHPNASFPPRTTTTTTTAAAAAGGRGGGRVGRREGREREVVYRESVYLAHRHLPDRESVYNHLVNRHLPASEPTQRRPLGDT